MDAQSFPSPLETVTIGGHSPFFAEERALEAGLLATTALIRGRHFQLNGLNADV